MSKEVKCDKCNGRGVIINNDGFNVLTPTSEICDKCNGKGTVSIKEE